MKMQLLSQRKLFPAVSRIEFVTFLLGCSFLSSLPLPPSLSLSLSLFLYLSLSISIYLSFFSHIFVLALWSTLLFFVEKSNATLHVTCFRSRDKFLYEPPRPWPPLTLSSTFDYVDIPREIKIHV